MARKSLLRITAGAALVAALTVFVASAAAGRLTIFAPAGLATPTAVAPANGLVVDALPAFSWAAVAKADKYEFQLAADAGMNSPVLGRGDDQFTTRNTRATLKKTIPNGTYWWRVRALQPNGTPSPWSPPRAIVKSWTSAPALQSPTHGAVMVHPTHPLVLRWSQVPRAAKYIVSIATDPTLGTIVSPKAETSGTVYAPRSTLLSPGTYYWGVTPVDAQGHRGAPSQVQSFTWTWPTSTTARVDDVFAAPEVFDPLFSWDPVAGAARYELEINDSVDFAAGSKVCCANPVIGSSYAPTVVFKDNTYYWRVRALDSTGNPGVWNAGPNFTKAFDKVPPTPGPSIKNLRMRDNLSDPGSDADAATPGYQTRVPVLRWDPVPGAASYDVDVTRYVSGICDWSGNTGHWRVKTSVPFWSPLGAGWVGIEPYDVPNVTVSSDGTSLAAGQGYCARVRARSDRDNANAEVYGDYTSVDDGTGSLGNPKAFTFVGYSDPDRECPGCSYLGAGDYLLPQTGSMNGRTPFFSWKPLPRLPRKTLRNTSNVEALTITELSPIPSGTGSASFSAAVREHAGDTTKDELVLTRLSPAGTWTYTYADGNLSALATAIEGDAAHSLDVEVHVDGTPLAHVAETGFTSGRQSYYVIVSKDASFSNIVDYAFTQLPVYAPRSSVKPTTYPDETTSYYWAVLPAIGMSGSLGSGDPLAASPQSFQKQSTPPAQSAPANDATVELQPTFRWTPVEGARRYRVQVADDPTFGSLLDDVLTDSTAYTSNTSYPADTILYWRVRADDENLIGLTWSAVGTFRRRLPAPVLSAANPGSGESIPLWTWAPVNGAVGYDVEVDEPDGDHSQFLDFRSAAFTAVKMTGTGVWGWRVRAVFPKQLGSQTQPGPWSATKPYTRTIAEPGGARTERSGVSVLLSWNAKPAAKNYRVQISQRADFQGTVEQVDTDNTSYAPTLLSPTYLAGGTFWWRVAAQDEDRNIGDFSPGQQFSLPKQSGSTATLTRLRLATKVVRVTNGRRVTVTVKANGRVARGVLVRVLSRGVTPLKAKTNRYGRVTFRIKKLGRGKRLVLRKLRFHAAKTGFLPARRSISIRY